MRFHPPSRPVCCGDGDGGQNQPAGQLQHPASLYYTSVPIQPGKQVAAVALPATGTSPGPGMHIFAIAIS